MTFLPRFKFIVLLVVLAVPAIMAYAVTGGVLAPEAASASVTYESLDLPPPLPPVLLDDGDVVTASEPTFTILQSRAEQYGTTRVIIGLEMPAYANDSLAPNRAMIQAVQQRFLGQMDAYFMDDIVTYRNIPFLALTVAPEGLDALAESPLVRSIEEDRPIEPMLEESVPLIGGQAAWAKGYSGLGQAVVVIDTGVDKYHPFLEGAVVSEACYSFEGNMFGIEFKTACPGGETAETGPDTGLPCIGSVCNHGTHVAGIAAGKHGVAPRAGIVAIKVTAYPANCGRTLPCAYLISSAILSGLDRAYDLHDELNVASVNMSLGTGVTWYGHCDGSDTGYVPLLKLLDSVGTATVVAAGNGSRSNGMSMPACLSQAVSVGAADKNDVPARFSNISPILDVYAPGVDINASVPDGEYAKLSGTSMAAPHVAGAWAVLKQANPDATVEEVLMALQSTGVPITDARTGQVIPRIQLDKALEAMLAGIPPRYKVVINEVHVNGEQWIELYNADSVAADLGGWQIQLFNVDSTQAAAFEFPAEAAMPAGGYVLLKLGSCEHTATQFCLGNATWSTDGGGAVLLRNSIIAADYVRWGSLKLRPTTGTYWIDPDPTAAPDGKSLGRDELSTDTDQGVDWKPTDPTPGSANRRTSSGEALLMACFDNF